MNFIKLKNNSYIVREEIIQIKIKVFKVLLKKFRSKPITVGIQQKNKFIESFQNLVNLRIFKQNMDNNLRINR